jgi:undecaprenyl pyrophosphate synthase
MNDLNHIAFIMDGNGRWGIKKKKVEITVILKESNQLKKLLKLQYYLKYQLFLFMFFQQKTGKDLARK